jgi:hypothetical protein
MGLKEQGRVPQLKVRSSLVSLLFSDMAMLPDWQAMRWLARHYTNYRPFGRS